MPWTPTVNIVEDWGQMAVVCDGVDVSWFRNAPVIINSYSLTDPYGHGPASFDFPSVTPFDTPGAGAVPWLRPHAVVEVWRCDADTGAFVGAPLWQGLIASLDVDLLNWSVQCSGLFSGFMQMQCHNPSIVRNIWDVGSLLYTTHYSRPFTLLPGAGPVLGITTQRRGNRSMSELDWFNLLLEMAVLDDGTQTTILPSLTAERTYVTQNRDVTTVHWTVSIGAPGVDVQLTRDGTTEVNRIFGEGVTPPTDVELGGSRWRNLKIPNGPIPEETPPVPGIDLTVGDKNSDTVSGDSVYVMGYELWTRGFMTFDQLATGNTSGGSVDPVDVDYEYTAAFATAVGNVQKAAGLPVTGVADATTWAAIWTKGVGSQNLNSAGFYPIAYDPNTDANVYAANGSIFGINAAADWNIMHVERFVNWGEGVTKDEATRQAQVEIDRAAVPRYYGTITLTSDPQEGHRYDIKGGHNIQVAGFAGGQLMHISMADVNPRSHSVTLTVDSHARAYPIVLAQIIRDRQKYTDPAFALTQSNANNTSDAVVGWDAEAGAGRVTTDTLVAGQWNEFPIFAAEVGLIRRADFTTNPKREWAMALFERAVSPNWVNARLGNPLDDDWTIQDISAANQRLLDEAGLVEVFGAGVNRGGYWPKERTLDETPTLTGRGRDDGNWTFYTRGPGPQLWAYFYPSGDCKATGQLYGQTVEGE